MNVHLTLVFTFLVCSLQAQIKEKLVEDFDLANGKKPIFSLQTFYNKKGTVTKIVQKTWGDYGVTTITSTYTFDSFGKWSGLVVSQTRKDIPEIKTSYTYVHSETGYEEIGKLGRMVTSLDKDGRPIRKQYYKHSGGLDSETVYEYDAKNRIVKEEKRKVSGKDNYLFQRYLYNDALNQRVEHLEYTTLDTVKIVRDFVTDLSNNKPIKTFCLTDSTTEKFAYDKLDNQIEATTIDKSGKIIARRVTRLKYW